MHENQSRPTTPSGTVWAVFLVALSAVAASCDRGDIPSGDRPPASLAAADTATPEVLATVDGEEIRRSDLPAGTAEELALLDNSYRQQRYTILQEALRNIVAERMLTTEAAKRGVTVRELVAAELGTPPEPTDAEITAWYGQNRSRLQGQPLDQLRDQIREHLLSIRAAAAADALDDRLRESYVVETFLDPYRIALDNEGSPALGPDDAAVTLVEFSDFECPFCGRFAPTVKRIEENYGDRVRIVYRQFPIPSLHPRAFKAAEASLCAHEQERFWDFHDVLFQEQDRLTVRELKERAGRLDLDQAAFDQCLDSGRFVEQVERDQGEGRAAGVTGTPALFVNGIPIPGGAVDYDVVAAALDAELERVGQ